MLKIFLVLIASFLFIATLVPSVAEDSSSDAELIVCSQNLNNFGLQKHHKSRKKGKNYSRKDPQKQLKYLVERFSGADCDVIAIQEVTGENRMISLGRLKLIAKQLGKEEGRKYQALVGETRDDRIRNGFLLATDRVELLDTKSYSKVPIPKLSPRAPLHYYSRGPLAVTVLVKPKDRPSKKLALINVHFKSKANSYKDPTNTKFEILRMEMAEGVKRIAGEYEENGFPVLILGDLNSDRDSASLEVLSGKKSLEDFRENCQLDDELESDCGSPVSRPESFKPIFRHALDRGQNIGAKGSFRYKGNFELIDEILLSDEQFELIHSENGQINAGFAGIFRKGSDHKLLWARLNW